MKRIAEYVTISIAIVLCSIAAFSFTSGTDPRVIYRNLSHIKVSLVELNSNYEEIWRKETKIQVKGDIGLGGRQGIVLREIYSDPINPYRREPVVVNISYEKMKNDKIMKLFEDLKKCNVRYSEIKRDPVYGVFFGRVVGSYGANGFVYPQISWRSLEIEISEFEVCLTKEEYQKM